MKLCEFLKIVDWRSVNFQEITLIVPLKEKNDVIRESEIDEDIGVIFDASEDNINDICFKNMIFIKDDKIVEDDGIKYVKDKEGKYYIVIW